MKYLKKTVFISVLLTSLIFNLFASEPDVAIEVSLVDRSSDLSDYETEEIYPLWPQINTLQITSQNYPYLYKYLTQKEVNTFNNGDIKQKYEIIKNKMIPTQLVSSNEISLNMVWEMINEFILIMQELKSTGQFNEDEISELYGAYNKFLDFSAKLI